MSRKYQLSPEILVPREVREYGSILDPSMLEPGDLILVRRKNPDWISKKIEQYQGELFAAEHAKWTHAVVSGGHFEICEATRAGVHAKEYWSYMNDKYELQIRRLSIVKEGQPPTIAPDGDRALVAYYAAASTGSKYGFASIFYLMGALSNNKREKPPFRSNGVICSQLFFEACMRAGYVLRNEHSNLICPAHLSVSEQLQTMPLNWIEI